MSIDEPRAVRAWTPSGWREAAQLRLDGAVALAAAAAAESRRAAAAGVLLPGLPNLHSHAFQRAMAGLAERRGDPARAGRGPHGQHDSFWSWRETMYAFAAQIGPDALHAIAAQLYVEMLEAGYTHVCEFHYLHHAPDGRPWTDVTAMAQALIAAAHETGIGLTLLPTLYMTGGLDGRPLAPQQRRFAHTVDSFLELVAALRAIERPGLKIGIALHSLRAVPAAALRAVLDSGLAARGPIHIHIAEQTAEVVDCLAATGQRPVAWLLDHAPVDARWCLVHATHIDTDETARLARSGAVAGLCPTTEANLGDGLFPLVEYLDQGGRIGVGSDSHISVSPVEELRWLEYGQRLTRHARNLAAGIMQPHSGARLFAAVLEGGLAASGLDATQPYAAGALVLDAAHPLLAARADDERLDSWIFAGNVPLVRAVWTADGQVVADGRHRDHDAIAARYLATLHTLRNVV